MRQLLPVVMFPPTNALFIVVKPTSDRHSILPRQQSRAACREQANLANIKIQETNMAKTTVKALV